MYPPSPAATEDREAAARDLPSPRLPPSPRLRWTSRRRIKDGDEAAGAKTVAEGCWRKGVGAAETRLEGVRCRILESYSS